MSFILDFLGNPMQAVTALLALMAAFFGITSRVHKGRAKRAERRAEIAERVVEIADKHAKINEEASSRRAEAIKEIERDEIPDVLRDRNRLN